VCQLETTLGELEQQTSAVEMKSLEEDEVAAEMNALKGRLSGAKHAILKPTTRVSVKETIFLLDQSLHAIAANQSKLLQSASLLRLLIYQRHQFVQTNFMQIYMTHLFVLIFEQAQDVQRAARKYSSSDSITSG
jgi:hypothetical protein